VGEDLAYETGTEHVNVTMVKDQVQVDLRVSNVFRRESGEWKMVHHHVDRNQTMLEILSKLETSQ
jgi:ketosteroid isomerase-like protein